MRDITSLIILLTLSFLTRIAYAGEQLTPKELVQRSEAIALVKVDLNTREVKILRWLMNRTDIALEKVNPTQLKWLSRSHCLPDRIGLKRWGHQFARSVGRVTEKKLWRAALEKGHYESLVFLRWSPSKNSFIAICETEVIQVNQWRSHPHFTRFKALVEGFILAHNQQKSPLE